jgi:hypothetical protein
MAIAVGFYGRIDLSAIFIIYAVVSGFVPILILPSYLLHVAT